MIKTYSFKFNHIISWVIVWNEKVTISYYILRTLMCLFFSYYRFKTYFTHTLSPEPWTLFVTTSLHTGALFFVLIFHLRSWIAAVPTGAVAGLEHFKCHAVFKEIEKKLQEVGGRPRIILLFMFKGYADLWFCVCFSCRKVKLTLRKSVVFLLLKWRMGQMEKKLCGWWMWRMGKARWATMQVCLFSIPYHSMLLTHLYFLHYLLYKLFIYFLVVYSCIIIFFVIIC